MMTITPIIQDICLINIALWINVFGIVVIRNLKR